MSVKFRECAADFPRTIAMAFFGAQPPSLAGFGTEVPLYGFHDDDFSTRLQAAALLGRMLTQDDLNLPGCHWMLTLDDLNPSFLGICH